MTDTLRILLIEDNPADARLLAETLADAPAISAEMTWVERLSAGMETLAARSFDLVLLDLSLPDSTGLETFRTLHEAHEDAAIVVLSGLDDEQVARQAVEAGAQDYLVKGRENPEVLGRAITYAVGRGRLMAQVTAADRMRREFIAITSHDLRSPLTAIVGFASILLSRWDTLPEEKKREQIEIIDRQAQRLLRLTDDLLTMSQIEIGAVEIEPAPVAIEDIARQALEAGAGDVEHRLSVPQGLTAMGDHDHVERILINFVTNAVKYGEPPIEVTAEQRNGMVEVRVRDHGEGVPASFVPELFDRFSRAPTSRSGPKGTGLGLYIVRGLARALGGDAWYEAAPDGGACFAFRLPA